MKTKIYLFVILLALISKTSFAQLWVFPTGSIGMGINTTSTEYKCFIKGDLDLTTYPDYASGHNSFVELKFKVGNGWPGAEFGTTFGKIAIWSSEWGYNDIAVGQISHPSDRRLKANIASIQNGLSIIRQLHAYSYNRSDTLGGIPSTLKEYGFIAQDVAKFLPEITDTAKGLLLLDYDQLIPFAIQGEKELDSITTNLSSKIDSVKVTADNGLIVDTNKNVGLGGNLTKDTQIGMNNHNLIFTDPVSDTVNNNIAIGSVLPYSKFSVNNATISCAGNFSTSLISTGYNWGVQAIATGGHPNIGGAFSATGGDYNYGLGAYAAGGSYLNYAFQAYASGGQYNTAGYFMGDLVYTGNFYKASDSMLKQNITPVTNAMSLISQLNPKTFTFKTTQYPYLNLPTGTKYGLIAQEVETVLPNLVTTNIHPEQKDQNGNIISPELSYKGLNYDEFVPIIIQGMKEMKTKNDSLNNVIAGFASRFDSLETMINNCCSQNQNSKNILPSNGQNVNSGTPTNVQYVKLSTENAIILNQNDPNPFAEETDITYFLPETVGNATIMFYDNTGVIIKAVQLQSKGNGTLHVYASDLSSGMYTYALIVDGKLIDSKKMMKTK